mmetsp:Transcript_26744/g.48569  ORF Transcript_26744/g.48569 Transcript_26744/m.48569 type:complete len:92 (-) Transcript_26744:1684-1959(-)
MTRRIEENESTKQDDAYDEGARQPCSGRIASILSHHATNRSGFFPRESFETWYHQFSGINNKCYHRINTIMVRGINLPLCLARLIGRLSYT